MSGGRVPPHDLDAEEIVLGSMMDSRDAAEALFAVVSAEDFYREAHRQGAAAIAHLLRDGEPVDPVAVWARVSAEPKPLVTAPEVHTWYAASLRAVDHALFHAHRVAELARRRAMLTLATEVAQGVYDGTMDADAASAHLVAGLDGSPRATGGETTWAPVALEPLLAGGELDEPPTLLFRQDGIALLYAGKVHSLNGEPEACKGWTALIACRDALERGHRVLYVDFEDSPASVVSRLRALGVDDSTIAARFDYVRPDEPLTGGRARADFARAIAAEPVLAVLDGVTEALAMHGLDLKDNAEYAQFLELLPRPLARANAAVLLLDHVVKNPQDRHRYAIGAQHKLAGIDVSYHAEVKKPFGRGMEGLVVLNVKKDRPGFVRQHAPAGHIAEVVLRADDDGLRVDGCLRVPTGNVDGTFRPTVLMERVSLALEVDPGMGAREIRERVKGKGEVIDKALRVLIEEGFVTTERDGRKVGHRVVRPYREAVDNGPDDDREAVPWL